MARRAEVYYTPDANGFRLMLNDDSRHRQVG
jgi:hypothetical protein